METETSYTPLPTYRDSSDGENGDWIEHDTRRLLQAPKTARTALSYRITAFLLLLSVLVILAETICILRLQSDINLHLISSNGLSLRRDKLRTNYEYNVFMSLNKTEADEAWTAILPGHGVIGIAPDYAASKGLPESSEVPDDSGRRVYVIEAYHAIHCVAVLRRHYLALDEGVPWEWSRPHDMHCFDALRQYVMCNFDDTLLWTSLHRDTGVGQSKKCQDWDALRDWAEKRSTGYFDGEPGTEFKMWNNYHEGDGLPVGSLS